MLGGRVAVVILNWNGGSKTIRCLEGLRCTPETDFIVVDNGSTDDSVPRISTAHPDVRLVTVPTNEGFARGTNIGLRSILQRGVHDVVVFLNNDAELTSDALLRGVNRVRSEKEIGLLTGKILRPDGRIWYGGGKLRRGRGGVTIYGAAQVDHGQCDAGRDVTFLSLAFAIARTEVIRAVGLLDEQYFFGQEEWDYSIRTRRSGYRLRYDPEILCIHGGDGSHDNMAPEFVYNGYRNKIIFQERYLPQPLFIIWKVAFTLYTRTFLPWVSRRLRGGTLRPEVLRYCALEALRQHGTGKRVVEADLHEFRSKLAGIDFTDRARGRSSTNRNSLPSGRL